MIFNNGKKFTNSNGVEILWKSLGVTADGSDNGLTITESTGKFNFNSKILGGVAAPNAAGQALIYDQLGASSGIATLDSGGKIPVAQLPNSIMEYQGTFDPTGPTPNLQNAAIAASKVIQDLTYTAKTAGLAGNNITITYVSDVTQGNETAAAVGDVFTVHIESGVSTATQVKAAVDAAAVLVDVAITGTAGNGQTTVAGQALAGGRALENTGNVYKVTVAGSHNFGAGSIAFVVGDYAIFNGTVFEKAHSGADTVISVNTQSGAVVLDTDDISEPVTPTNMWFTAGRAKAAAVADSITDGVTDVAPSQNAVFDALALKADASALGGGQYATFTNKEAVDAITAGQFVKMLVNGQVTKLTSTDSVGDETFFGCVKAATIAKDGTGSIYLPEVGARVAGFTSLDVTKMLYADATTPGAYTQTRPVAGKVIILGRPISDTEIVFIGRFDFEYA
jgi:hypothetical protein